MRKDEVKELVLSEPQRLAELGLLVEVQSRLLRSLPELLLQTCHLLLMFRLFLAGLFLAGWPSVLAGFFHARSSTPLPTAPTLSPPSVVFRARVSIR